MHRLSFAQQLPYLSIVDIGSLLSTLLMDICSSITLRWEALASGMEMERGR